MSKVTKFDFKDFSSNINLLQKDDLVNISPFFESNIQEPQDLSPEIDNIQKEKLEEIPQPEEDPIAPNYDAEELEKISQEQYQLGYTNGLKAGKQQGIEESTKKFDIQTREIAEKLDIEQSLHKAVTEITLDGEKITENTKEFVKTILDLIITKLYISDVNINLLIKEKILPIIDKVNKPDVELKLYVNSSDIKKFTAIVNKLKYNIKILEDNSLETNDCRIDVENTQISWNIHDTIDSVSQILENNFKK